MPRRGDAKPLEGSLSSHSLLHCIVVMSFGCVEQERSQDLSESMPHYDDGVYLIRRRVVTFGGEQRVKASRWYSLTGPIRNPGTDSCLNLFTKYDVSRVAFLPMEENSMFLS